MERTGASRVGEVGVGSLGQSAPTRVAGAAGPGGPDHRGINLVGSRTGALLRRFGLAVAPRFLWGVLWGKLVPVTALSNNSLLSARR